MRGGVAVTYTCAARPGAWGRPRPAGGRALGAALFSLAAVGCGAGEADAPALATPPPACPGLAARADVWMQAGQSAAWPDLAAWLRDDITPADRRLLLRFAWQAVAGTSPTALAEVSVLGRDMPAETLARRLAGAAAALEMAEAAAGGTPAAASSGPLAPRAALAAAVDQCLNAAILRTTAPLLDDPRLIVGALALLRQDADALPQALDSIGLGSPVALKLLLTETLRSAAKPGWDPGPLRETLAFARDEAGSGGVAIAPLIAILDGLTTDDSGAPAPERVGALSALAVCLTAADPAGAAWEVVVAALVPPPAPPRWPPQTAPAVAAVASPAAPTDVDDPGGAVGGLVGEGTTAIVALADDAATLAALRRVAAAALAPGRAAGLAHDAAAVIGSGALAALGDALQALREVPCAPR